MPTQRLPSAKSVARLPSSPPGQNVMRPVSQRLRTMYSHACLCWPSLAMPLATAWMAKTSALSVAGSCQGKSGWVLGRDGRAGGFTRLLYCSWLCVGGRKRCHGTQLEWPVADHGRIELRPIRIDNDKLGKFPGALSGDTIDPEDAVKNDDV